MEDLVIYKNTEDDELLYVFHWGTISPEICYVYDYRAKIWWSDGFEAEDFLEQANEAEEWTVTNLLDVLVATGWTEEGVLKELLEQTPGGWEALQRNLYIAKEFADDKKTLEGLPTLNPQGDIDYHIAVLGKELYIRKLSGLPNSQEKIKKIEKELQYLLKRQHAKAVQASSNVSCDESGEAAT